MEIMKPARVTDRRGPCPNPNGIARGHSPEAVKKFAAIGGIRG